MPGDLHKLWRARDPKAYHVEYGYSCMGYEIAGGLGIKLAAPDREVFVLVGDGSYLMMAHRDRHRGPEGIKLNIVLVQNHGFGSIGALSESLGSQRFGTAYRFRNPASGLLDGARCRSTWPPTRPASAPTCCGPRHRRVRRRPAPGPGQSTGPPSIYIETDPLAPVPTRRAGGTCPYPRFPLWKARRRPAPSTRRPNARQRPYL